MESGGQLAKLSLKTGGRETASIAVSEKIHPPVSNLICLALLNMKNVKKIGKRVVVLQDD